MGARLTANGESGGVGEEHAGLRGAGCDPALNVSQSPLHNGKPEIGAVATVSSHCRAVAHAARRIDPAYVHAPIPKSACLLEQGGAVAAAPLITTDKKRNCSAR